MLEDPAPRTLARRECMRMSLDMQYVGIIPPSSYWDPIERDCGRTMVACSAGIDEAVARDGKVFDLAHDRLTL